MSSIKLSSPAKMIPVAKPLIDHAALHDFGSRAQQLLLEQRQEWPMLRRDYASLPAVQTRTLDFESASNGHLGSSFQITLQYNPARLISSAAKVDAKSVRERKCFLCTPNLPRDQRGLDFGREYVILCNPFPIFPEHFTIPHKEHRHQQIAGNLGIMLELARQMATRYTVFYNGPKCGASAPDHLHFQAGSKGFMPIDREYQSITRRQDPLCENRSFSVWTVENYLRRFVSIESNDPEMLAKAFAAVESSLQQLTGNREEEPLMNVLAGYTHGVWQVIVFPRARHRPSFYFAEGDEKILLSPAAVEMGGLCAVPLQKDFRRLDRQHVIQAFEEVTLPADQFEKVRENLATTLALRIGRQVLG
jgi:ATP adenylyltransferase/5',5'''-P-1,P-4-tetraphosphate phosphorylase II